MSTPIGGVPGATSSSSNQLPSQPVTEQEFLQLLAAQLQYQDPTQPTDPTQFVGELAQFATLASTNSIETSMQSLQSAFGGGNPLLMAAPLLGKTVTVADASGNPVGSGTVNGLQLNGTSLQLEVSGLGNYPLSQVTSVNGT
jgi:flagellar basal-body rod modification protein FlgD